MRHRARAHVPHRDDVVDPVEAVDEPIDPGEPAGQVRGLELFLDARQQQVDVARSRRARGNARSGRGRAPGRSSTSATGRSRLMCAFIPASANCSGATPRRDRCCEQRHPGRRSVRRIPLVRGERGEEEPANVTSSRSRNATVREAPRRQLEPRSRSPAGRGARSRPRRRRRVPRVSIACSRAMTSATVDGAGSLTYANACGSRVTG